MSQSVYDKGLERNPANFQPLTPLGFLERAASVHPDQTAIVHGNSARNYRDFYARSRRLACVAKHGVRRGDICRRCWRIRLR